MLIPILVMKFPHYRDLFQIVFNLSNRFVLLGIDFSRRMDHSYRWGLYLVSVTALV
jgi:hypothetical protein